MSNRTIPILMGFVAVLVLAVGVALVVLLAGGGGDDDDNGLPANPGENSDNGNEDDGDDGVALEGFCEGQFLVTYGSDPASILDPIQARDEGTAEYIVEIFGGLVTLDLDLNVVPDIAEDWTISDDGTVYTFTLRDDVLFHSGRRVTAEDFKYSFERAADPANASPTATLYLSAIVGLDERFANEADEVEGVQVIDERTLQITIEQPRDWFLAELTYPVAFVVDQEQIESNPRGWTRTPNGTGPFRLIEFAPGEQLTLVRNDAYHLGVAKLERVIFDLATGSLLTAYENDEIHIGLVPALELAAVQGGSSPLSEDYRPQPRMAVSYLAFNNSEPPFDDINVRKALAMTVNREAINEILLFDTQRVADGILPPEIPGYDEAVSSYQYNPEEARRLLEESQYAGNVPRIILSYSGAGGDAPDILTAIQDGWRQELGLEVELQATEYSAFLRELRRGTFQMFAAGWIADYPDPEDFIDKLFAADSPQNEQSYNNDQVQELIEQARQERDTEARFNLLREAEQLILDDAAIIPTFWPIDHQLVKPCVANWPEVPMTVPRYRFIEIDPNAD